MKKLSTQTIVIIILAIVVVGFAYNEWGSGVIPKLRYRLSNESEKDKLQIGQASADFRVIEYYSYTCQYCKNFKEETWPMIFDNYIATGKLKWVFRPVDPELAIAVLCAEEQDKFSEFHSYLFDQAQYIRQNEDLKQLAKNKGMDEEAFWQCYTSEKYEALVVGWYDDLFADFNKYKVAEAERGTPAFLIGNKMITGAQSYDVIAAVIEEKLGK
jgi:protein-disulfide isomerase